MTTNPEPLDLTPHLAPGSPIHIRPLSESIVVTAPRRTVL